MAKQIRVTRILTYIGTPEWIDGTMGNNVVQVGRPLKVESGGTITEQSREYREEYEPFSDLPLPEVPRVTDLDDELPF